MVLSRKAIDNEWYNLSEEIGKVAVEIIFYLEGKFFGTKYNSFPTAGKLAEQILSIDLSRPFKGIELYEILNPSKERKEITQEEIISKVTEERNSLVSKLKAINYMNKKELENLKDFLISANKIVLEKAYAPI